MTPIPLRSKALRAVPLDVRCWKPCRLTRALLPKAERPAVRRRGRCCFIAARCVLLAVLLAAGAQRAEASSGAVLRLPQGPAAPKNGLQLAIDTRWVDSNGYRPVRIEAVNWPPGPAIADRRLRVVLQPRLWQWGRATTRVTGYVEIPEGAARGEATLAVPQCGVWGSLEVWVYEDGRLLEDLSASQGMGIGVRAYREASEALPAILIVDADAPSPDVRQQLVQARAVNPAAGAGLPPKLPDLRCLVTLLPEREGGSPVPPPQPVSSVAVDDADTLLVLQQLPRVEMLPPGELPTRWIDLSCFDLAFITLADLRNLAADQPSVWQALRDWAASGPTLCVYDMELSPKHLAQLETLLGLAAGHDAAPSGWRVPDPERAREVVSALKIVGRSGSAAAEQESAPKGESQPEASPPPEPQPFVHRAFRLGHVVAMQTDQPLAAGRREAAWLLNELDASSWMWYRRHGLSWHRENTDYWKWIVPGIGRAPVGTFLLLITVFVIVIGPVNYFFLRRRRRLYLLLVTVPVGAGLVTLALFAYALLSDGLGVRARVRSFTEIDQPAGHAVSWSRQSYYAGLAPSGGLTFPERAAVLPLDQYPAERRRGRLGMQHLVWSEGQNLVSGYIGARSSAQFLVVESGPSDQRLLIAAAPEAGDLQATNHLEAVVDTLVVKDGAGRVLRVRDLAIGQSRPLEAVDPAAARQELHAVLAANQPAYPPGYDPRYFGGLGFSSRYYRSWSNVDSNLPDPTFASSILERSLQATLSGDPRTWPPRTYVAITRTSPGVSLGHDRAREEASLHVVSGRW